MRDAYRKAQYAGIACGIKNTGIGNGQDDIGRVSLDVLAPDEVEIVYVKDFENVPDMPPRANPKAQTKPGGPAPTARSRP